MGANSRRDVLKGISGGALSLTAFGKSESWPRTLSSTASGPMATEETCTPGHTDGDPACDQIRHDDESRTWFESAETGMLTTFRYPCGWETTTQEYEDRIQTNVTRSNIGSENAYVDVQVRNYFEPVSEGYLEEIRAEGEYQEITYEYGGEERTGLLSSIETAQYGTTAHAVVPGRRELKGTFNMDKLYHVELVSTLKGVDCSSPPDYRVVEGTLRSLGPNKPASVTINDQLTKGHSIVVDSVRFISYGYVVVHKTAGLESGNPVDSYLGHSAPPLSSGGHELVRVSIDMDPAELSEPTEITARVHEERNENDIFDWLSDQQKDGPVVYQGSFIEDTATIQGPSTRTPTETWTRTPTKTETSTPTPTSTSTTSTPAPAATEGTEESGEDGAGFGIGTTVSALALGALLFIRNRLRDDEK